MIYPIYIVPTFAYIYLVYHHLYQKYHIRLYQEYHDSWHLGYDMVPWNMSSYIVWYIRMLSVMSGYYTLQVWYFLTTDWWSNKVDSNVDNRWIANYATILLRGDFFDERSHSVPHDRRKPFDGVMQISTVWAFMYHRSQSFYGVPCFSIIGR